MNSNQFNKSMQTIKKYVDNKIENKQPNNSGTSTTTISRLKNHSWSVLGDSISQDNLYVNKQYWDYVNTRVGGMKIYNYGVASERIINFINRCDKMNYSDIITVFGGVNDWGQSNPTPLGTITDTTTGTFYGNVNVLCNKLATKFPQSLIVFITPLGNNGFPYSFATGNNSLGLSIYDYANAIKDVCKLYKFPVIDACSEIGFTPDVSGHNTLYFHDGLHLNILGHEVLSYLIEDTLLRHYIPTVEEVGGGEEVAEFTQLAVSDVNIIGTTVTGLSIDDSKQLCFSGAIRWSGLVIPNINEMKITLRNSLASHNALLWYLYADNNNGTYKMLSIASSGLENGKTFILTIPGTAVTEGNKLSLDYVNLGETITIKQEGNNQVIYRENGTALITLENANMFGFAAQQVKDSPLGSNILIKKGGRKPKMM